MKKFIIIFIGLWACILVFSLNDTPSSGSIRRFEDLPTDVKKKFKDVYNYCAPPVFDGEDTIFYFPPYFEAYNLNGDSVEIKPSIIMFDNSYIIISDGKAIKLTLDILEHVFIIKDDSIYYPVSGNGITAEGKPLSYFVDIDTLLFQASAMNRRYYLNEIFYP